MNLAHTNCLITKAIVRWRSKYSYPHFVGKEIENAEDVATVCSSEPTINSQKARTQPISPNCLKTKTIPGVLKEKGPCITIRESKYRSQNCSLVSPSPLWAQQQFHGNLRQCINLGAGSCVDPRTHELLFCRCPHSLRIPGYNLVASSFEHWIVCLWLGSLVIEVTLPQGSFL